MKKYFIFAASALALASCSSDDFLGEGQGNGKDANTAINFSSATGSITRATDGVSKGDKAAKLLGEKFYVLGTKGTLPKGSPTESIVFDNYQVNWKLNTAGTTADNTNDWAYVGVTTTGLHAGATAPTEQSIKYWDYTQPQYDFIAYSVGNNILVTTENGTPTAENVVGTAIKTPKADNTYTSYTLKAENVKDFTECYYTDVTPVVKSSYGQPVQLTFKNLTAKVRVAFYETIPGYTVSDLKFYTDGSDVSKDVSEEKATLYTTGNDKIATNGDITVTYPVVGEDNKDKAAYNKAFISVAASGTGTETTLSLGKVNYADGVLATTAKNACMAGGPKDENNYYTAVLPAAGTGKPLTIRMNYKLTSTDGSGEVINVYGASAVIPASYTQWQPNYAYTYIFKISDNTNGYTNPEDQDHTGLFPITFDAVVADIDNVDFNQETITTVATPSVTTYAFNSTTNKVVKAYTDGAYPASSDIYFSVTKDGTPLSLTEKGQLYTLNKVATEAQVIDALQVIEKTDDNSTTGRNGIVLKKATTDNTIVSIPTDDGQGIQVTSGNVAKLTSAEAGKTYAYVYDATEGTPTATYIFTAVTATGNEVVGDNEYYPIPDKTAVAIAAGQTLTAGQIYYKRYPNNNKTLGVKVVTIASTGE